MKTIFIAFLLMILAFKNYGQAEYLTLRDMRTVADLPGDFKFRVSADLKERAVAGVPGFGHYATLMTVAPWYDYSAGKNHQMAFSDDGVFHRTGDQRASGWESWTKFVIEDAGGNVGIGTSNPLYALDIQRGGDNAGIHLKRTDGVNASWYIHSGRLGTGEFSIGDEQEYRMVVLPGGNVGIGTTLPKERLSVNGRIRAQEVKVEMANWPDYVFAKNYQLPTIEEVKQHVKDKGHLSGIPTASEAKMNGIDLGDMNAKLLRKIEEMTLYLIELNDRVKNQQTEINNLKKK
jgi:hypothetical protein